MFSLRRPDHTTPTPTPNRIIPDSAPMACDANNELIDLRPNGLPTIYVVPTFRAPATKPAPLAHLSNDDVIAALMDFGAND